VSDRKVSKNTHARAFGTGKRNIKVLESPVQWWPERNGGKGCSRDRVVTVADSR
jgi:hypothetical protein